MQNQAQAVLATATVDVELPSETNGT